MSKFMCALFLILLPVNASTWVMVIKYNPNEGNHTTHCFTSYGDIGPLKQGEEKRIEKECAIANCKDNRDVIITGCAPVQVRPPCRLEDGDILKRFPLCCYEINCPVNDNNL